MSDEDFRKWLSQVFHNAFSASNESVNVYCWFAMSNYSLFRECLESAGFRYMQVCYWLKDRFVLSINQNFHRVTEPVMILYKDWKNKFINMKYAKNSDVWQMDRLTFEESLDVRERRLKD